MPQERILRIQFDQPASRLDQFLADAIPDLSRSQIQKLIRQGKVWLSAGTAGEVDLSPRPSAGVQPGDLITLYLPAVEPDKLAPEPVPLDIVFEDEITPEKAKEANSVFKNTTGTEPVTREGSS